MFALFTTVVRFDHRRQVVTVIRNVLVDTAMPLAPQYEQGRRDLDALLLRLHKTPVMTSTFACSPPPPATDADREQYCRSVHRAKEHITDGDIFQVVLSRRGETSYSGDPFPVYRALRLINPSPYLFHLDFGDTVLLGSSPELLVRVHDRDVEVMPIAGTRRRGADAEEDRRLAEDLLADEKERAEHVMLIDLGRNDVGRIAAYGSVSVPDVMRVERYSHVMHIVSTVRGTLRKDVDALDALVSCFPAGTVSGAPKIRAMEIIADLEGRRRGVYAGAVGYLGFDGTLDTCIAIRTVVCHGGHLSIQAGAGIVADSDPDREFVETENKARALIDAVTLAAGGLRGDAWEELAGRIAP
jgi:anthranilate synthase component 1